MCMPLRFHQQFNGTKQTLLPLGNINLTETTAAGEERAQTQACHGTEGAGRQSGSPAV